MIRKQFAMIMVMLWTIMGFHVGNVGRIVCLVMACLYAAEVCIEIFKERNHD